MIADLKPYAEYEESGLSWLGRVPGHWNTRVLKRLCSRSALYGANIPASDYVSVGVRFLRTTDITDEGTLRRGGVFVAEAAAHDYMLADGDLLVSRSGTIGRSLRYRADVHGPCAYAGYLVRFVPKPIASADYLFHFTKSLAFADFIRVSAVSSTIENVNGDKYANMPVTLPPPSEQAAIVRFLDWANGRLERAIRAKRKVIALLHEQKQAIIHRAVTRGLDPSVPLKPSGIPWLGEIPQHWEVISLRMRYSVELGKMLDAKRITGRHSIPYLRNRDVQWDRVLTDDLPVMDIPPSEIARYTVKQGDLLVCEGGQVGRSAFWDEQLPVCGFQKALHRVRCLDSSCDYPRFFFYQMQLAAGRGVFTADGNENTIAHLTCEKLRRHRFAFPSFAEQAAIADFLDGELRQFQITASRLEREIDLLREYRTRLVADVVTGKLDVREAAARLPGEAPPDLAADDADLADDPETSDAEALE